MEYLQAEYAGPLLVYLWFYGRPWIFYGDNTAPISQTAQYAKIKLNYAIK